MPSQAPKWRPPNRLPDSIVGKNLFWQHAQCSVCNMGDQKPAGSGIRVIAHFQLASTYMPAGPATLIRTWATVTISM